MGNTAPGLPVAGGTPGGILEELILRLWIRRLVSPCHVGSRKVGGGLVPPVIQRHRQGIAGEAAARPPIVMQPD